MPRKPSSVFVLTFAPGAMQGQAYRERLTDSDDVETVVGRRYQQHPAGAEIFVVEDTKVDGYVVGVRLDAVDDPRLPDEEG